MNELNERLETMVDEISSFNLFEQTDRGLKLVFENKNKNEFDTVIDEVVKIIKGKVWKKSNGKALVDGDGLTVAVNSSGRGSIVARGGGNTDYRKFKIWDKSLKRLAKKHGYKYADEWPDFYNV